MLTSYWYSLANCCSCCIIPGTRYELYMPHVILTRAVTNTALRLLYLRSSFLRRRGGGIDYSSFIDESTMCSMYNGGFVMLLPLVPFLCTWYLSVQRNKLQIIHILYIMPLIWNYTSVFISHRQVITYQKTLDLSH